MIKSNKKLIIGFILGAVIFSTVGVCAATLLNGKEVLYDNAKSNLNSTNVQDAIDELYDKWKNPPKIVAYTYNEDTTASNYCVTGNEETCEKNTCYENTAIGSCPTGTIIEYMVNARERHIFHVMYDNGGTITMLSQREIIKGSSWAKITANTEGPNQVFNVLNSQTGDWGNVKTQTFTLGTTIFKNNAYVTCSEYNSCTSNSYTHAEVTVKGRLITVQEAADLGCTREASSCPMWMYNYLLNAKDYGAAYSGAYTGYWTFNASSGNNNAWLIRYDGSLQPAYIPNGYAARAVVEITK